MKVSIKINNSILTRDFSTYIVEREVSKFMSNHHRICDDCAHNLTCDHTSIDDESIKRAFSVGKERPQVSECSDFSSFYSKKYGPEVPLTDDMIIERYATAFSASVAHPTVKSHIEHIR